MTHFPATKVTAFVDPIAHAWAIVHPRWPLPIALGGPGGGPRKPLKLPDPPRWVVADLVLEEPVQTPAPQKRGGGRHPAPLTASGDAELGPGKFLGKPCPHGHRVRYVSTKACVMCLRAAVKRSNEKRAA